MEKLVSVIVPIYNSSNYLHKCLDSISIQTYRNLEVLMVDDGSLDDSSEICRDYENKDSRFHYYYKENGGLGDARNFGISKSCGDFMCFIDADDWIEPDYVSYLLSGFSESVDVVCCNKMEDGTIRGRYIQQKTIDHNDLFSEYIKGNIINSCCTKLFSRKVCESVAFLKLKYSLEDMIYTVDCFPYINKMVVLEGAKYNVTVRNDSLSHSVAVYKKQSARLFSKIYVLKKVDENLYENTEDLIRNICNILIDVMESRIDFSTYNVENDVLLLYQKYKTNIKDLFSDDIVMLRTIKVIDKCFSIKKASLMYFFYSICLPGGRKMTEKKALIKKMCIQIIKGNKACI